MKKLQLLLLPIALVIPMTVSALWWNPFTWKVFQRREIVPQVQMETLKTPEEKINELQKQLDDLKKQQATSTPTVIPPAPTPVVKKEVKKTNSVTIPAVSNTQINDRSNIDICTEIEGIQTVVPVGYIKNGSGPCVLVSSQQQNLAQPQTPLQTEQNYASNMKTRLREIIELNKSYSVFLQDANSQLRSANLTLSGYNTGGLYGQARDAAINLSNSLITVNTNLMMKNNSHIASLQAVLDSLNNDQNSFVSAEVFNKFPSTQSVQSDIESVEQSINKDVSEVLKTLQFH